MRTVAGCFILFSAVACGGIADPAASDGGATPPGGTVVRISTAEYTFSPASLTIAAGTTVRLINAGSVAHTTTSDAGTWDSGTLAAPSGGGAYGGGTTAGEYQFTFSSPGTYMYHCTFHVQLGMRGTVTVTP